MGCGTKKTINSFKNYGSSLASGEMFRNPSDFFRKFADVQTLGLTDWFAGGSGGSSKKPKTPQPASYYQYGPNGEILSQMTWNKEKNAYEMRTDPTPDIKNYYTPTADRIPAGFLATLTPAEQALINAKRWTPVLKQKATAYTVTESDLTPEEAAKYKADMGAWTERDTYRTGDTQSRKTLTKDLLANLSQAPEDRIKMYDEYAQSYTGQMKKALDEDVEKSARAIAERVNATGMTGSSYNKDLMAELYKNKSSAEQDIADKGIMARETLANQDKSFWAGLLNQMDSGGRADVVSELNKANSAAGINQGASNFLGNMYSTNLNYNLDKWKSQKQLDLAQQKMWLDTITGAAGAAGAFI